MSGVMGGPTLEPSLKKWQPVLVPQSVEERQPSEFFLQ